MRNKNCVLLSMCEINQLCKIVMYLQSILIHKVIFQLIFESSLAFARFFVYREKVPIGRDSCAWFTSCNCTERGGILKADIGASGDSCSYVSSFTQFIR